MNESKPVGMSRPKARTHIQQMEWHVREHAPTGEWTAWTLELAREHYAAHRLQDVVRVLGAVRNLEFPVPEAYSLLGLAHWELGEYAASLFPLQQAVKYSPQHVALWVALGDGYFHGERLREAIQHYREACGRDDRDFNAFRKLAQALFAMDRCDEAADLLREACGRDSTRAELWSGLGWILLHQGKHAEAWQALNRALELRPGDMQCLKSLALVCFALNRKEESYRCYERVLQIRPGDAESHFGVGLLHLSAGNAKAAYQQYETLVALCSPLAEELHAKIAEIAS